MRQNTLEQTLRELQQRLSAAQQGPAWTALGVAADVDANTLRASFLALTKRSHPHSYAHLDSPEISRVATELFIAYKNAYDTLAKTAKPPTQASPSPQPPKVAPVSSPRPGDPDKTLPLGPWKVAPPLAQDASSKPLVRAPKTITKPGLPIGRKRAADAEIAIAEGLKHLASSRFDAAYQAFDRARQTYPEDDVAERWLLVCKARRFRDRGQVAEALQTYRDLLAIDPQHREAKEQLGAEGERGKRGGLLGKLFGNSGD